jgi:hypothetical protein
MLVDINTYDMDELDLGMTNFDGTIDDGFAEALKESPGGVFGSHSGWDFYGEVFFFDGKFHEEVWVHNSAREIITADSLEELMVEVSSKYGWN